MKDSPKQRWQTAWKLIVESNGYQCVEEISDAKRIFKLSPVLELAGEMRASIEYDACSRK
jgi:hypothetical protein